ncbi:MAG: hypothetical protein Q4G26_14750 [Paracoccus sp. (in: a-proteobacteria)]|nr:hypothetical protein [Paracoccus sp. (in: a-proteobacteria)]
MFQPGAILHEVIVGALKSQGKSLEGWPRRCGLSPSSVRNVTFGMSAGIRSRALLDRLIDDAGREVVSAAYRIRMDAEAQKLAQVA